MKYVVLFEDDDEFAHKRQQHMAEHLQFLADNSGRIDAAGPLKDTVTAESAGGIWIVDASDAARARELVEADPFYPTGLRKSIRILEWTRVFADGRRLI